MNDKERTAPTQLPPALETPSEIAAAAVSTMPPPDGGPPSQLEPESDATLRAEPESEHGASPEVKLLSTNQLIALYQEFKSTQHDLLSETGGFAKLLGRRDERLVDAFAKVVDGSIATAVGKLEPRFAALEREVREARAQADAALKMAHEAIELITKLEREQRGAEGAAAAPAG